MKERKKRPSQGLIQVKTIAEIFLYTLRTLWRIHPEFARFTKSIDKSAADILNKQNANSGAI